MHARMYACTYACPLVHVCLQITCRHNRLCMCVHVCVCVSLSLSSLSLSLSRAVYSCRQTYIMWPAGLCSAICKFASISSFLLGCGATCSRLEMMEDEARVPTLLVVRRSGGPCAATYSYSGCVSKPHGFCQHSLPPTLFAIVAVLKEGQGMGGKLVMLVDQYPEFCTSVFVSHTNTNAA